MNMESMATHYQFLVVDYLASDDKVFSAYQHLLRQLAPNGDADNEQEAAAALRQVNKAYVVLSDPASRREYNNSLLQSVPIPPTAKPAVRASFDMDSPRPGENTEAFRSRRLGEKVAGVHLFVGLVVLLYKDCTGPF